MAGSAPSYDNVLWPGGDGIRVPTEVFGGAKSTLALRQLVTVTAGSASSVTLQSTQVNASELVITNMSTTTNNTVLLPGAMPGNIYAFKNSSGSACTFKVSGATGVSVASGSHAILVSNAVDIERWTPDA